MACSRACYSVNKTRNIDALTFVQCIDVAKALEKMLEDDSTASQTYELYGPTEYSMAEIAQLVDKEIVKHRRHVNLPKPIWKPLASILNKVVWWSITSADQVEREFINQNIDKTAKTFHDLGIEPDPITALTFDYLVSTTTLIP